MAKDANPFSRAISAKAAATDTDELDEAAEQLRLRHTDEELRQPDAGSSSGRRDVPSAITDNPEAAEKVGDELGLGTFTFESAKDKIDEPDDGTSSGPVDSGPEDQKDRLTERVPQFNIDGMSTQDALNAASGADNTDVSDLLGTDMRDAVGAAKAERNPLNDPLFAAGMSLVDDAANSAATNPYSVAQGSDALAQAMKEVYGEPPKDPDEGKATDVELLSKGKAGSVTEDATYWDDEKGEVVYATDVSKSGKAKAEEDLTTVRDHNKSADADTKSSGTGIFGAIGEYFADKDYQEEWGDTEKKAAELHAARQASDTGGGSSGSGGGSSGLKQYDPDSDRNPPTESEIAFGQAAKAALGIRHIPGDIDPVDGDGTQGSGSVDRGRADAVLAGRDQESLLGNPGSADAGRSPSGPREGSPGFHGSRQGGDIDPEEGSAFTGGQRSEGPQDVDFGVGRQPLVGFRRDDEEEEEEKEAEKDDEDGEG